MGYQIGTIHAIDLAAGAQPVESVTLNPNSSLSYPLELVNSTLLKVRSSPSHFLLLFTYLGS